MNGKPTYKPAIDTIEFAARAIESARHELEILARDDAIGWMESVAQELNCENTRLYGFKRYLEHLANLADAANPATSIEIAEITQED